MGSTTLDKAMNSMLCMQRHSWEQGIAGHALMALERWDLVETMALDAVHRQLEDGRLGVMGDAAFVADPVANGENLLATVKRRSSQPLTEALVRLQRWIDQPSHYAPDGTPFHRCLPDQVWADSFYMIPPFLAAVGQEQRALEQIERLHGRLWRTDRALYGHIWDERDHRWEREESWGCGNGWAVAGIVRTLANGAHWSDDQKSTLIDLARSGLEGCLGHLRPDGLFHFVVDDASTFVETNLSQMLAYSIFTLEVLGGSTDHLVEAAHQLRAAANRQVDDLGRCQGVCGAPRFDSPGTSTEGQAFYILMETAAESARKTRNSQ